MNHAFRRPTLEKSFYSDNIRFQTFITKTAVLRLIPLTRAKNNYTVTIYG